jgi:hypothetical protein
LLSDTVHTRTMAEVSAPDTAPDGSLFFLMPDAAGLDVHRVDGAPRLARGSTSASSAVVRPPHPQRPDPFEVEAIEVNRYAPGQPQVRPILSGSTGTGAHHLEAGLRVGDILGRYDLLALGSLGAQGGLTGAMVALATRAMPVEVRVENYVIQRGIPLEERAGSNLTLEGDWLADDFALRAELGGGGDGSVGLDSSGTRAQGHAQLGLGYRHGVSGSFGGSAVMRGDAGATGGTPWKRAEGGVGLWLGREWSVSARYTVGVTDATSMLDTYTLGGVDSSLLPDPVARARVSAAAFEPGSAVGTVRDVVAVAAGPQPVRLFGERHRMEMDGLSGRGASAVGIRGFVSFDEQPFLRLPGVRTEVGLACQVEDLWTGLDPVPCNGFDDYRAWATLRWEL